MTETETAVGTCETCGRESVVIRPAKNGPPERMVCVEDKPCFEAWKARKRAAR